MLAKSRIRAHVALEEELVVLAKSLHPRKRAYAARFKGWRRWWWQRVSTLENERMRLVLKGGGGGGGGKESPPLKTSVRGSFSWMVVVCQ